jgi:pimeloyl-ACP methyl ester carboxylesterase
MRRTLLCAIAATSLTAMLLPAAAQARTGAPTDAPPTIAWGECASPGLQSRGAECAKVSVPLDYAKPTGTKIKLAVSRIKHTVPDDQYQGPMLVNPGGPGGSGLTLSVLGEYVPKNAGDAYDWIGFDPRGVGSSEPAVSCDPKYAGYNRPKYVPTSSIKKVWLKKAKGYTRACDAKNGKILDHLTTIESAKDMDSIRKALGAEQINYYGFSYGTYLGQVFATLYPDKLRRVVFDGTVDPRGVWYRANLDQDVAFDRNINIWFGWLAEHDSTYHLGATKAAVSKLFYATESKLYKKPAKAPGGKLGGSEWVDAFLYAGYYQSTWLDLADTFSAFVNDGDVEALEAAYLDASGYGDDNGYAVYLGVQCTDVKWPQAWSTWSHDNWKTYRKAPFETWSNAWYNEPCRHWPAKAHKPVTVTGKKVNSLLMINETLDAATPYAGSLEVRKRFPTASLIAVPGGTTHSNSLNGNACVDDAIADYLLTGAKPARVSGNRADQECEALPQPDPEAGSAKRAAPDRTRLDLQKESLVR